MYKNAYFSKILSANTSLLGALGLTVIFMMLVPVLEWPDSTENISRAFEGIRFYPFDFFSTLNQLIINPQPYRAEFFSDLYRFRPNQIQLYANLERLPIVLGMILAIYFLASREGSNRIPLAPPLIFALCSPSQEAVAIFLLLCAYMISEKYKGKAIFLSILATICDRSMGPNTLFLVLFIALPFFRAMACSPIKVLLISLIVLFITNRYSAVEIFSLPYLSQIKVLDISYADILYNRHYGEKNLLALVASTMGLYGWMAIRPSPFWLYYLTIGFIFIIGFLRSEKSKQGIFLSLSLVSYLTMWLLPPVSQARYYPLLIVSFWSITASGVSHLHIRPAFFQIFILGTTATGCLLALLKNI